MQRTRGQAAFSLVEVLVATAITVGIGAVVFQLFHQNERIFRDQAIILEMQQTARVVIAQAGADIRMAGQAMPPTMTDVILPGSGTSRLNIRTGFSAAESIATAPLPLPIAVGNPLALTVDDTSGFSTGRQAFLWTDTGFARATINSVSGTSKVIAVTPSLASIEPLQFTAPPAISLDEAVAFYLDAATQAIRRTTATNTEDPASPSWAPANELATNVVALTFLYYDAEDKLLTPDSAEHRLAVASIEARVRVRSPAPLSDGSRPTYSLSIRSLPRNLRLR